MIYKAKSITYPEAKKIFKQGLPLERWDRKWSPAGHPTFPKDIRVNKLQTDATIAYESALRTHQMDGFGEGSFVDVVNSMGDKIPDQVAGLSTKALLAGLAALLVLFRKG